MRPRSPLGRVDRSRLTLPGADRGPRSARAAGRPRAVDAVLDAPPRASARATISRTGEKLCRSHPRNQVLPPVRVTSPLGDPGLLPRSLRLPSIRGFCALVVRLRRPLGDVEPKLATLDPDGHAIAGLEIAGEQHPRKLVLDQTLNGAPQRSRAELGVEALLAEVRDRRVGELRLDPLGSQPAADLVKQKPGDLEQLLLVQRPEDDDLVDPVEELGPEALPQEA